MFLVSVSPRFRSTLLVFVHPEHLHGGLAYWKGGFILNSGAKAQLLIADKNGSAQQSCSVHFDANSSTGQMKL